MYKYISHTKIIKVTRLKRLVKATTLGATVCLLSLFQPQVVSSSGWMALKQGKSNNDSWFAMSSGEMPSAEHTTSSHGWLIDDAAGRLLVLYWYIESCCLLPALSPCLK